MVAAATTACIVLGNFGCGVSVTAWTGLESGHARASPMRLRGGVDQDAIKAARAAMAARAKQRQQAAPPADKKDLPPSATDPSAALNVGKDEAQLMGMEGRAARLGAKSQRPPQRQESRSEDDSGSSDGGLTTSPDPRVRKTGREATAPSASRESPPTKKAASQWSQAHKSEPGLGDESSSSDSAANPASLGGVAKKMAATSLGQAVVEGGAKKAATAGGNEKDALKQVAAPLKTRAQSDAAAAQAASAAGEWCLRRIGPCQPCDDVETSTSKDSASLAMQEKTREVLQKMAAFIHGTEETMASLGAGMHEEGANAGGGRTPKEVVWQTLMSSMAEMDAVMGVLQQLHRHGAAHSLPLPPSTDAPPQPEGLYLASGNDAEHPQFNAEELVVASRGEDSLELWQAVRLVADGGTVRVLSTSTPPDSSASLVGMGSLMQLQASDADAHRNGEAEGDEELKEKPGEDWLHFGDNWRKRVHIRGLPQSVPTSKHPSTDITSRWMLGYGSEGSIRDCRLGHLSDSSSGWCTWMVATVDVWGGPWLVDKCVVKSVGGSALLAMRCANVNVTCSRVGGESASATAADCVVAAEDASVTVGQSDMCFAARAADVAADAQMGAGSGVAVMGRAVCVVTVSHVHDCARGVFVDDSSTVRLDQVAFSVLASRPLAAGATAGEARLTVTNCVGHELNAGHGGKQGGTGAEAEAASVDLEGVGWMDGRRPGFSEGHDNVFSLASA